MPVTVSDIETLLQQMLNDYNAKNIPMGPPQDKATKAALTTAIDQMKADIAKIPPNGVSNIGNVKRKTFKDSKGKTWRIDLENNAGKNLTQ